MKTDKRFMLSDRNLRDILFIKSYYQNPSFDMKEFIELYMKKELKYDDSFTKTNETFKKSSADTDMLLNDDTCVKIIKENEEKEKIMELDEEEDVNEVNIIDLIYFLFIFTIIFKMPKVSVKN